MLTLRGHQQTQEQRCLPDCDLSQPDDDVEAFLAKHKNNIPLNPGEWTVLDV